MSSITFDSLLENRVGFGKYQYLSFAILALVDFTDGVELLTMSVLMSILQIEWKLSDITIEITTSSFYFGMFIGAIITGKVADQFGRRNTIIFACFFQFLVSLSFTFIDSEFSLILLRLLYGVCYGFSLPITIASIAEISTRDVRGKMIICTNYCVTLGKLYGLLLIYLCLNDFHSGNWKLMMKVSAFTSLAVCLGNWYYLKESPRYLIASCQINEGVEVLNYMGRVNNPNHEEISCSEVNALITYQKDFFNLEDKSNHKALFYPGMLGITLRLWSIWFALIFIEFGQYAILPFILGASKSGFGTYIMAVLGECPAIIFSLYVIDKENFGRKNTLTYCLIALCVMYLLIYFTKSSMLGILLASERFLMKNCFSMLIPLSAEVYPTLYRTVGYGWASACGRVAAFVSPFILFKIYKIDLYSPFLVFLAVSLIAAYSSYTLPYDTSGINLDEKIENLVNNDNINVSMDDKIYNYIKGKELKEFS